MAAGDIKELIDDGDFLVYLASNETSGRLSNPKASIRSGFITPLGGLLDLDDNWEVAPKSLMVRSTQVVVGDAVLKRIDSKGEEVEILRTTLPPHDYHDLGDVVKQTYEWLKPQQRVKDMSFIQTDPVRNKIHRGGIVSNWHDRLGEVDTSGISISDKPSLIHYWRAIRDHANGLTVAKSSRTEQIFSENICHNSTFGKSCLFL